MQTLPKNAFTSRPLPTGWDQRSCQAGDRAYRAVTIAAILLVLGSLGLF
jgi:hypothetical protein